MPPKHELMSEQLDRAVRLTDAAPYLLKACKAALADWEQRRFIDPSVVTEMTIAIARAEGR